MSVRFRSKDSVVWRRAVGANIRRIRRERGLSQAALAERAGSSASYVSLIERGNANPRLETITALAAALGVSPVELLKIRNGGHTG